MYKILIVEDDRIIADNVCEQLLKWGYDVKIADDFNDVLKIFAKYEPQLVLMDIGLPYFNGYHWCMQIRNISFVMQMKGIQVHSWIVLFSKGIRILY